MHNRNLCQCHLLYPRLLKCQVLILKKQNVKKKKKFKHLWPCLSFSLNWSGRQLYKLKAALGENNSTFRNELFSPYFLSLHCSIPGKQINFKARGFLVFPDNNRFIATSSFPCLHHCSEGKDKHAKKMYENLHNSNGGKFYFPTQSFLINYLEL